MRLGFARWTAPVPSGGNRYDAELAAGLRRRGVSLHSVSVPLPGPGDPGGERATRAALATALKTERRWLVDGIVAVAAPDLIAAEVAGGRIVAVLVHHFEADRVERDAAMLQAASAVVCTSRWAAAELRTRYGIAHPVVAAPGVEPAPVAAGSRSAGIPRILGLAALTPTKDPLTTVAALAEVADLAWTAHLVGPATLAPPYAAAVRAAVAAAGLADRIVLTGVRTGAALAAEWAAADLLVHPARAETYGMVVAEAVARGVPALVAAGTGAVEALQAGRHPGEPLAGAIVPGADPAELAMRLRGWLTDDALADRWRSAALAQRDRLPDWSATTASVLAGLGLR